MNVIYFLIYSFKSQIVTSSLFGHPRSQQQICRSLELKLYLDLYRPQNTTMIKTADLGSICNI